MVDLASPKVKAGMWGRDVHYKRDFTYPALQGRLLSHISHVVVTMSKYLREAARFRITSRKFQGKGKRGQAREKVLSARP